MSLASDAAPSLRDDEPLDSDQYAQAWARAKSQAERDALLYEGQQESRRQIHNLTAAVDRLSSLVGNSAQAARDMAREYAGEHKVINANLTLLVEQVRTNAQAIGQIAEGQGMIAAELAARARQDSVYETEITAQRAALQQTAADLRTVRLKAAGIKAAIGAGAVTAWEIARHLFPSLAP